jgi:hypothetical protein
MVSVATRVVSIWTGLIFDPLMNVSMPRLRSADGPVTVRHAPDLRIDDLDSARSADRTEREHGVKSFPAMLFQNPQRDPLRGRAYLAFDHAMGMTA